MARYKLQDRNSLMQPVVLSEQIVPSTRFEANPSERMRQAIDSPKASDSTANA